MAAWLWLGKKLNRFQLIGMALVLSGLFCKSKPAIEAIFESSDSSTSGGSSSGGGGAESIGFLPILLLLTGTIFHSLTNVVNQKLLTVSSSEPIPPASLSAIIGVVSVVFYTFYYLIVVNPTWRPTVSAPIGLKTGASIKEGDPTSDPHFCAIAGSIGLLFSAWLHCTAFFFLLGTIGVVSCGMVKGGQTGAYVVLCHFLWCEKDAKYCIDMWTGLATGLSIVGVLVYSFSSVVWVTTPVAAPVENRKDGSIVVCGENINSKSRDSRIEKLKRKAARKTAKMNKLKLKKEGQGETEGETGSMTCVVPVDDEHDGSSSGNSSESSDEEEVVVGNVPLNVARYEYLVD